MQYIFYFLGFLFALLSLNGELVYLVAGAALTMVGLLVDFIKNGTDAYDVND